MYPSIFNVLTYNINYYFSILRHCVNLNFLRINHKFCDNDRVLR